MNVKHIKKLNNTEGGLHFLWDQLEVESHVILSELPRGIHEISITFGTKLKDGPVTSMSTIT